MAKTNAIVIGGEFGGLVMARVLSNHFQRVTILEKDNTVLVPAGRTPVSHAAHYHVLPGKGHESQKTLFPDLDQQMKTEGIDRIDWGNDFALLTPFGWCPPYHCGKFVWVCSRNFLEQKIREQVSQIKNFRTIAGAKVQNICVSSDQTHVSGVNFASSTEESKGESNRKLLEADLVIDSSGRFGETE